MTIKFRSIKKAENSVTNVLRTALERDYESVVVYGFELEPSNKVEILYSSTKSRAEQMCALWDALHMLGET